MYKKWDISSNPVAAAIERVGGMVAASAICRVSNNTMCLWRNKGCVTKAAPAVLLANASGIPVEALAGVVNWSQPEEETPLAGRRGGSAA